jgi:transcriptional regulator GlxA family with amidase domain
MSQFHFSHLFKQSIGTAPYQYLLQQRVERAKQLLKQTERSIMDIALECGFNSHSHSQHAVSAIYRHDADSLQSELNDRELKHDRRRRSIVVEKCTLVRVTLE